MARLETVDAWVESFRKWLACFNDDEQSREENWEALFDATFAPGFQWQAGPGEPKDRESFRAFTRGWKATHHFTVFEKALGTVLYEVWIVLPSGDEKHAIGKFRVAGDGPDCGKALFREHRADFDNPIDIYLWRAERYLRCFASANREDFEKFFFGTFVSDTKWHLTDGMGQGTAPLDRDTVLKFTEENLMGKWTVISIRPVERDGSFVTYEVESFFEGKEPETLKTKVEVNSCGQGLNVWALKDTKI